MTEGSTLGETGPLTASGIAGSLPPGAWILELLYVCIRLHEVAIKERSVEIADYNAGGFLSPGYEINAPRMPSAACHLSNSGRIRDS